MRKIFKVAQREFIETIKRKAFIISFIITAFISIGLIIFVDYMSANKPSSFKQINIAIIDLSKKVGDEIKEVFQNYNSQKPSTHINLEIPEDTTSDINNFIEKQKDRVKKGELKALIVLKGEVVEGAGASQYFTITKKMSDLESFNIASNLLNESVLNVRLKMHNLSPELVRELQKGINLEQVDLDIKSEKKEVIVTRFVISFFFMYLMFMGIFGISQQMLTSIIEEKSSRVIEVLLSSLSPFELMAGKILGLSAVGFILVGVWGFMAFALAVYKGYTNLINFGVLVYFIIYFIPGFLLISSLIAAIGSTCNTIQDAQSYMLPIMLIVILPMMVWMYIAENPEGVLAIVLSFIPLITPLLMILRIAVYPDIPVFQIIATLFILVLSVPFMIYVCAKIFRTGILMYGKQPSPREILHWIKYK